ncbi:MAG TPA: DUF3160 domain-containing protein [bacterium]|nr:DUF3160 domain-containing protein [bacterium]
MFIDHSSSLVPTPTSTAVDTPPPQKSRKILFMVGGAILLLCLGGGGWWYVSNRNSNTKSPEVVKENPSTPLPENPVLPSDDFGQNGGSSDFKAENLAFGTFYQSVSEPFTQKIKEVSLPINTKSQVTNYYNVARKINIDSAIPNLNKNGFAIINNPFVKEGDDFFSVYRQLNQRGLPLLLTSDFLFYYYQNSLKEIYKEIESSYFYDNLWKVNKQLFQAANSRYQERQRKLGVGTDSLLEAERLEASYFATSLMLLSPQSDQISDKEDLTDTKTFKPSEAERYAFAVPVYLADDVNKELTLIREAKKSQKSPVMLYERNYTEFKIPAEYAENAKLRNFYIASRWQSTLFPLSFREDNCPDCLLDRDDWTINQISAYLIGEDLSLNQSLKNEWAKVYKVMSFFSGLRSGLTYLHYQAVRQDVFPGKNIDDVFTTDTFKNLVTLQSRLKEIKFSIAEGGLSDRTAADRPILGMRLLQTNYWPAEYMYDRLTYPEVGSHNNPRSAKGDSSKFLTSCLNNTTRELYRCRGMGFDILGSVTSETPSIRLIQDNINYKNYSIQRNSLTAEFAKYDKGEWYVNNFWTTLSIVKSFINEKLGGLPFSKTTAWKERQITASLANLTTLTVPRDEWQATRLTVDKNLQTASDASKFHFIETQNSLNDELLANATMLFKAFTSLGVVKDNDTHFKELIDKLKSIRQLTRKELQGETLSTSDYQFIVDLVNQYTISKPARSSTTLTFTNALTKKEEHIKQSVGPLKLLLMIYEENNQKILVIGPILNYKEE